MSTFQTLVCVAALLALTACAAPAPVVMGCPAVKPWSAAEQNEMRRELDAMAADAILIAAMSDYVRMRDEARACRPAQKPKSGWPFAS
jgi:hypothetical protein